MVILRRQFPFEQLCKCKEKLFFCAALKTVVVPTLCIIRRLPSNVLGSRLRGRRRRRAGSAKEERVVEKAGGGKLEWVKGTGGRDRVASWMSSQEATGKL